MTLFISNIDILLSHFLFIARGHAGSRRVSPEPTGSLLMSNMSKYKILQVRSWYSKYFSTSPMLCAYPPIFYPASAQYLAFSVVSISRQLLVMRRPLPILGTIVANKYRDGIYAKLLTLIDKNRISRYLDKIRKEHEMGIEKIIPELLRRRLRAHQSINQGFSNFIWRGNEYEMVSHYISVITANTAAMNFAICLGFQIWYSLMPTLMLTIGNYDYHYILSPEAVQSFKDTTRIWSPQTIKLVAEQCETLNQYLMQAAGSTLETGGACTSGGGTSAESLTFDPMEIRGEESHKVVLRKLVIACLAVCILSTVSYITVSGTELCLQFLEGKE